MSDVTRLDGQVAIVTGAAQGIGRGIALVLAEAGATIVIGDIQSANSTVDTISSNGGQAISMIMDVSSPKDANALVEFAVKKCGHLDILINNAGLDAPSGNAWDLPDKEWERTIAVNLSGVFYCSRAALTPMLKAQRGVIVNISSRSALLGTKSYSPAYNASKAGIIGLTMAFSVQVADMGIRVNTVLPALVESRDFGWSAEQRAMMEQDYPLGLGTPWDIGQAVRYLVSPAARWVTGTALYIHGGADKSPPDYTDRPMSALK